MRIYVNEEKVLWQGEALCGSVRNHYKPDADIVICNGAPVPESFPVNENDHVVLIKRGEVPSQDEMAALMRARNPEYFQPALCGAVVAVAGAGGLGSAVAVALARSFVSKIIVADFDIVEPSNLNRQQYFTDQIGMPKVEALKANLARINPYMEVVAVNKRITDENVVEIFHDADIVAECFDTASAKAMLTENVLLRMSCPLVAVSGVAGHADVENIICRRVGSRMLLIGDGSSAAEPGRGLTAAKVGVAANMQACKIIELLVEKYCENKDQW